MEQKIDDIPQGSNFSGVRKKPWGTAHAVWTARDIINSPFVIINADDYYGQNASKELQSLFKQKKMMTVLLLLVINLKTLFLNSELYLEVFVL